MEGVISPVRGLDQGHESEIVAKVTKTHLGDALVMEQCHQKVMVDQSHHQIAVALEETARGEVEMLVLEVEME